MARTHEYPLAALLLMREEACERARIRLASTEAKTQSVRNNLSRARAGRERLQQMLTDQQGSTATAGALRAADALAAEAYGSRLRSDIEAAQTLEQAARRALDEQERALDHARSAQVAAEAELEAARRHHGQWLADQRKQAEYRDELEAEELVAGRVERG